MPTEPGNRGGACPDSSGPAGADGRGFWRTLLLAALVIGALVAFFTLPPDTTWLVAFVEWIRGQGPTRPALFAVAYVLAAVLLLPGSVLTIGGGFVYGPLWGFALISPVSVLAATAAFILGRTLARGWVMRRLGKDPRLTAINAALGQNGFKIVVLLQLSPLFPFNTLNYLLGLTRVRAQDFVLGSWIGMLPGTALYVYIGSLVTTASELASGSQPSTGLAGQTLLIVGFVATLGVTVLVTRIARQALKRSIGGELS